MDRRIKNPTWVMAPLITIALLTAFLIFPWMQRVDLRDPWLATLCLVNTAIWWVVLWWSLHHLTFKLVPLFYRPADHPPAAAATQPRFAILYPTCDDFQWAACQSCATQDYPPELLQVYICDDSRDPVYKQRIGEFAHRYPHVRVIERPDRRGFKAGNLNHAIAHAATDAEWIIILDADQSLPQDYVSQFAKAVSGLPESVAFVQARQASEHVLPTSSTRFQQAIGFEIDIFYAQDLALRSVGGFLPLIGHGAALRRSAWARVRFPEVVSEDFAMAMELRNQGMIGVYSHAIQSWEAFPRSFGAFLVRFRKFAGGTAELYRQHLLRFVLGPATFTEKTDLLMMVGWYALMPVVIANGYLSAYVGHRLWQLRIAALHPVLPYVFVGMFLLNIPVLCTAAPTVWHAVQHWFWSSAVYGACLPIASVRFLRHFCFGKPPQFDRTPKDGPDPAIGRGTCLAMILLGVATVAWGLCWSSPFTPVLIALGVSYASVPVYTRLNESSAWGAAARWLVLLPGCLYLYALWEMWSWQGV